MSHIVVVGIGADGMAGLPPTSRTELARATVIYGSPRQLDLLDDSIGAVRRRHGRRRCCPHCARCSTTRRGRARGGQRRSAAARRRQHPDPAVRARSGDGAAARVLGDAGVLAGRLGGTGHRDHQPGHRGAAHRGAPRRPGRRVVAGRLDPGALARLLTDTGRGDSEITVLEQLGGPAERRRAPPRGSGRRDRRATWTSST